ncbi:MAG: T9SS type A sorting domain-containing protein [Bacteroidota bacterium]
MKTTSIIAAFFFAATALSAQETIKKTTVHEKKVTIVNGVRTETDTTYTTEGNDIHVGNMNNMIIIDDKMPGGMKQLPNDVVIHHSFINDSIDLTGKTMMIKKATCGATAEDLKNAEEIQIFVVKKIDITDATSEERKTLPGNKTDQKLAIANMKFYPNPSTGKFNLSFNLPEKGDTEISVLNNEGKIVYKENLPAFSGNYDKEIDISKNAKGIYFVKLEQGKHSQVKKIVIE